MAAFTQRDISADYERQRRLRLAGRIAQLFGSLNVLLLIQFVISFIYPLSLWSRNNGLIYFLIGIIVLMLALFILAIIGQRVKREWLAVGGVISATLAGTMAFNLIWTFQEGLNLFSIIGLMLSNTVIVLVGLMGGPGNIARVTLALNALTVALIISAPKNAHIAAISNINELVPVLIPALLLMQWGIAALMFVAWGAYQRTLRDLGNTRMAYERARQLDALKDQFINRINHELRTPVMAMQGYLELLSLTADHTSPDRLREILAEANEAGDDLRALLSSILETGHLDEGARDFTPESVDVNEALAAARRLIDPREAQIDGRDIQCDIPGNLTVWGEKVRVQQILTNLLANAMKYSPMGMPIAVMARVVDDGRPRLSRQRTRPVPHQMIEITVRDWGLGIPIEQQSLLFQRFVRLPRDLASGVTGTGLGLHLCRVLAEAMGGAIWVESTGIEGEGSTFHLRLPLPPPALAHSTDERAAVLIRSHEERNIAHP